MIQIDMPMPISCLECRFRDTVQSGCNAAEEPGFCVFVGLPETEIVEWEDWKKKISSGRDPRCPLKEQEAVKPYIDIDEAKCPVCKVKLTRQELLGDDVLFEDFYDYCPHCGRKVKWD